MAKKESGKTTAVTKSLSVRCRYCGQKNSVKENYKNGAANCGKCKLPLSNEQHRKFSMLTKDDYVHDLDRQALNALKAIPGIDTALKKLLSVTGESAIRVLFTASAVKVTPKQCPDLHAKLEIACETLGVEVPELFIQQNPIVNAFTGGVEKPIIVLHSSLVERLTDEEILAVIAHEVGHIHAKHVLYLTAAQLLLAAAQIPLSSLPIAGVLKDAVSLTMRGALLTWMRRAELSCDRAALLVVQDPDVIGRTMMKLCGGTFAAKIDYEQFLEQARDFQKTYDEKWLDKFWADIINAGMSHPFPVWRVSEILDWVDRGEYAKLVASEK
jgi:Zn-dependent protease with chaperone function